MKKIQLTMALAILLQGCSAPPPPRASATPSGAPAAAVSAPESPAASATMPLASLTPDSTPSAPATVATLHPTPTTAKASPLTVKETGVTRTLDCDGQDVVIEGSENRLILKGRVGHLRVDGSTNEIDVSNVTFVDIKGVENRIQWSGKEPQVNNPGNDNRVQPFSTPRPTGTPSPTPLIEATPAASATPSAQ